MRRIVLGLAGILIAAVQASAHEVPGATVNQLVLSDAARGPAAVVDAFHAALRRGDTHAAADLLEEDALIFEQGGSEHSKAEYAAHHLAADSEFSKAVSSTVTRRAGHSAGSLAWIATEAQTNGTYKDKPVDMRTTETVVLRHAGAGWKIVHIHWSSAARR